MAGATGGIHSFRLTLRGDVLIFSTRDGGLYQYTMNPPAIGRISTGDQDVAFPAMDMHLGRYLAWQDRKKLQIFLFDRSTGKVGPLPISAQTIGAPQEAVLALVPSLQGLDPFHVFVQAVLRDASVRRFRYDIRSEVVRTLSELNAFVRAPTRPRWRLKRPREPPPPARP